MPLTIDWATLRLDPAKTTLWAPAVGGFQSETVFAADTPVPLDPGRGWVLVVDETPRQARRVIPIAGQAALPGARKRRQAARSPNAAREPIRHRIREAFGLRLPVELVGHSKSFAYLE